MTFLQEVPSIEAHISYRNMFIMLDMSSTFSCGSMLEEEWGRGGKGLLTMFDVYINSIGNDDIGCLLCLAID